MTKETFYITTPIFYTSGKLHLGHAYTSIACDVLARFKRNQGFEVYFQSGSDEHGQKIQKKAQEANVDPQTFVDRLVPQFKQTLQRLNISQDYFIRTTDVNHKKFVQDMLQKAYDKGDIYKAEYSGLYCVDCEQYYKEDELEEGQVCPIHKKKVDEMREENYFFKLSNYQDKLLEFYEKNPDFLSPKNKAQETLNRVKEGLEDISISRSKETLNWGIELPFDDSQVTYVWFDALYNYLSGLKINNKKHFWPADVHVVGKDIMWFHKVFWPAFLMSTEYELPKKVFAHGWWTSDGQKMGKALGNVVDPVKLVKKYGVDEVRYFCLANGVFGEDLDFSDDKITEMINAHLNNDLGNLVSRVHAMTQKYFEGVVPGVEEFDTVDEEFLSHFNIKKQFEEYMNKLQFFQALDLVFGVIRETNAYVNKTEPWKIQDKKRLQTVMTILTSTMKFFSEYLDAFMPEKMKLLRKQYNFNSEFTFTFEMLKSGHKLGEKENLFQKISLEKKSDSESTKHSEKRDGFSSLNIRVGKILSIEQHPEAEKLYVETIDLGEEEPRQIVSGLKNYYTLEEMKDKKVLVLTNLKPAKLRGVKSNGMVLVAEETDSKLGLLTSDTPVGTYLQLGEVKADNPSRMKIDTFFEMDFTSDGEKVYFNNKEVTLEGKSVQIDRNCKGKIC